MEEISETLSRELDRHPGYFFWGGGDNPGEKEGWGVESRRRPGCLFMKALKEFLVFGALWYSGEGAWLTQV